MKSKRYLSINNSLVHGICNYNCITCGVNKSSFVGPKAYQSHIITEKLISRIIEAAHDGIYIRYIANSGDGEPTLHPEFSRRMRLFGDLQHNWNFNKWPPPEVSIVTNGLNLTGEIFDALSQNRISLKISFPTSDPEHYGEIVMMKPEMGTSLIKKVATHIEEAISRKVESKIPDLEFHISPPHHKYIRTDFPKTINFLAQLAKKNGLKKINLLIFPAVSNRTGAITKLFKGIDVYKDYFSEYNKKDIDGVRISMNMSLRRFYPRYYDLFDLLRSFKYPCIWYGNYFISPFGDSCCCNDQNLTEKHGNVMHNSLKEILEMKEKKGPTKMCESCNQKPEKLYGTPFFVFFKYATILKAKINKLI